MEKTSSDAQSSLASATNGSFSESEKASRESTDPARLVSITGVRFHFIIAAICICLFIITIEITIVNTALITIANDLRSFHLSSWVVTAYLLTYVGFLIIISKLSDIVGRKSVLLASVATFTIWAGACGAAQTTEQLIVFRAFKGIGAAGVFSSSMIIIFELITPEKIPKAAAGVSVVFAFALVLGPIFGGAINESSSWRWCFLFNVPVGTVVLLIFTLLLPRNFPYQDSQRPRATGVASSIRARIDWLGAVLVLGASVLLVVALENAGLRHPWKSALVVAPLTISGVMWVLLLAWEWKVTRDDGTREPVFPWRFIENRVSFGMMLTIFLLGPPSVVAIFSIPQRFQVVNNMSPLAAGVRILPYTAVSPISSMVVTAIAGKFKIPPVYLVIFCSICQTVGFALLATVPITETILISQYGYQALAAFGCGANMTLLTIMTPYMVTKKDAAVAQGSIGQLRYMGAAIGVSIVTCVLNSYVQNHLSSILSPTQVEGLLRSSGMISLLPVELQSPVRLLYAEAYNLQMKVLIGFSAAQVPAALLMWQKNQVVLGT
ncbi:MFS general substrate transporter [Ophiobolus disseminans]|uniref:MFS general substrate transporter n=1 Tax=Ophiobolus disseminans TaxID=1469910 RepID=A0A6A6ZL24_9PLEO|nr:MFS general substrate transporter [Ophiobolus disseminans]